MTSPEFSGALDRSMRILQLGFFGLAAMIAFAETREDSIAAVLIYTLVPLAALLLYVSWYNENDRAMELAKDSAIESRRLRVADRVVSFALLLTAVTAAALAIHEASVANWRFWIRIAVAILPAFLILGGGNYIRGSGSPEAETSAP